MRKTKLEKMRDVLNEKFREDLAEAVDKKFGIQVETYFDIFGTMRMVTRRVDGLPLGAEAAAFIEAYEAGYLAAMRRVKD